MSKYDRKQLTPGRCSFEIRDMDPNYISKASARVMLKACFMVIDQTGNKGMIWDYYPDNLNWKVEQLIESLGKSIADVPRENGKLVRPDLLIGLTGECTIKIENSKNPAYPDDQERIDRFLKAVIEEEPAPYVSKVDGTVLTDDLFDDEIPF